MKICVFLKLSLSDTHNGVLCEKQVQVDDDDILNKNLSIWIS